MRKCVCCFKSFVPKKSIQFYCTDCLASGVSAPKGAKSLELRVCQREGCGREFWAKRSSKTRYCCIECSGYAARGRHYSLAERKTEKRKVTNCVQCGKPIGESRSPSAVTCSEECARIRARQRSHNKTNATLYVPKVEARPIHILTKDSKGSLPLNIVSGICSKLHISYGQYQQYSYEQLIELADKYKVNV